MFAEGCGGEGGRHCGARSPAMAWVFFNSNKTGLEGLCFANIKC